MSDKIYNQLIHAKQQRIRKRTETHGAHVGSYRSCTAHEQTQYPNGYMD